MDHPGPGETEVAWMGVVTEELAPPAGCALHPEAAYTSGGFQPLLLG